jgi:hypothetical protein
MDRAALVNWTSSCVSPSKTTVVSFAGALYDCMSGRDSIA